MTAASNLLGTRPPVASVAARAHEVGALLYVDAVHHTAHAAPDLAAMGADLLVCSPYKFFGPHCGALVADPELLETLRPDKLLPSSDAVPERFELGTLPYELLAGVTAAVDFIASVGSGSTRRERLVSAAASIAEHELRLRLRIEEGLAALGDHLTLHSRAADRTSTLFLTLRDRLPVDAYEAPGEARRARPGRHLLRLRDLPRAAAPRRLGPADRARGLHRRLGGRPAARGPQRLPGLRLCRI